MKTSCTVREKDGDKGWELYTGPMNAQSDLKQHKEEAMEIHIVGGLYKNSVQWPAGLTTSAEMRWGKRKK